MRMSGCKQIYIHIVLSPYQALAASVLNNEWSTALEFPSTKCCDIAPCLLF
jgi:hypothetical protein